MTVLLWDTCVLYRFLNGHPPEYLDHLEEWLKELSAGKTQIFLSTVALAEIRPSRVKDTGKTPAQIVNAISAAFRFVAPTSDIMSLAGYLRDQRYRQTDGPEDRAADRVLSLGDSIHLATGVALREEFGVQELILHSFDEGKNKGGESGKRNVPIVGFHNWCRDLQGDEEVQKVLELTIKKPDHPSCKLPTKNPNSTSSRKPPAS